MTFSLKRIFNPKIWLPVLVLAMGGIALAAFIKNRPDAKKKPKRTSGALVEVLSVKSTNEQVQLQAYGLVRSSQQVTLSARISGTVKWLHPSLKEGNFFKKGDLLVTLDSVNTAGLNYTLIQAPFDGMIQQRKAEIGQYVAPGTPLLTLTGSQRAEIYADLPANQLGGLLVPGSTNQLGIPAQVKFSYGNRTVTRTATVQRHLMDLTNSSMMARLVIEVSDPFALNAPKNSKNYAPLFLGDFVEVIIPAKRFSNVVVVPAHALRANHSVWLALNDTLEIRPVEVAHIDQEKVFVTKGLKAGELLITSPLKGAANGLKLKIAGAKKNEGKKGGKGSKKKRAGKRKRSL